MMGKGTLLTGRILLAAVACSLALLAFTGTSYAASPPPVATTGPADGIGTTVATLHGTVRPNGPGAIWWFQYGKTSKLGKETSHHPVSGGGTQDVSQQISGLTPGTKYFYRLVVSETYKPNRFNGTIQHFFTTARGQDLATTSNATGVSSSSAQLNGLTNTDNSESQWFFQYGRTTAYGSSTPHQLVGPGLTAVAQMIKGLKPNSTYHFRLVVQPGSYPAHAAYGKDATFKTPPPTGRTSLLSRRLRVHNKVVSIPFSCTGKKGARCTGKVSITARGKVGKRTTTVNCGKANFSFSVTRRKVVKARVGNGCATLLRKARHHRINATLKATFPNRPTLKAAVVLVRK